MSEGNGCLATIISRINGGWKKKTGKLGKIVIKFNSVCMYIVCMYICRCDMTVRSLSANHSATWTHMTHDV